MPIETDPSLRSELALNEVNGVPRCDFSNCQVLFFKIEPCLTLIGSDNQSYTFDINNIAGCTNFSEGEYTLAQGASAAGCVVYEVPNGVTVAKVQFTPNAGFSGDTGEWLVQ